MENQCFKQVIEKCYTYTIGIPDNIVLWDAIT